MAAFLFVRRTLFGRVEFLVAELDGTLQRRHAGGIPDPFEIGVAIGRARRAPFGGGRSVGTRLRRSRKSPNESERGGKQNAKQIAVNHRNLAFIGYSTVFPRAVTLRNRTVA